MLIREEQRNGVPAVLVVDDEQDVREIFARVLGRTGYKVVVAESGDQALLEAATQRFDLAFIDVAMPGLDGAATLRQLKMISPHTQVVMITGFVDGPILDAGEREDRVAQAMELGARGCLRKPFGAERILRTAEYFAGRPSPAWQETPA